MARRRRRSSMALFASDRVWLGRLSKWAGGVVRREPAHYQQRSVQETWRCRNPHCGQWVMHGAHRRGVCNFCGTPR